MVKKAAAIFILLLSAQPAGAGGGGDALPFLKLDTGARGAALAGAYCASGDDALSVFYNPAGTALVNKKEILLGHNEWLEGIRNETAAYVHPLGPGLTLFAGINALFSGSMAKYDPVGDDIGTFSSMEGSYSAGLSGPLGNGFYGGAALKALSQHAAGRKAMAWAGDAGILKESGDWKFGISGANFGGRLKFATSSFPLPLILRAGVSRGFHEDFTVSAEGVKAGRSAGTAALGAEGRLQAGPKEYFFLRAGYKTGRSRFAGPGFTAGVGLTSADFRLDYAFAPYGDLGDAHRITVALGFGAARPEKITRYSGLPPSREKLREYEPPKKTDTRTKAQKKKDNKKASEVYFMW
ncbi:MAG: hypothetical protein COX65_03755 [Elusimicrobia bacterium CG_4_10_14_0_2_um_filter_56_8]|nr:MAG: hypothetical protein AUJ51_00275 [Elusimicrobia bacterium CG1_02_56_21]PJA15818.1 MAG: hypothetical protein COX65_03755 [Elusimicrobia bacterium CG_4_10_14_0_2_um_filter_56_8]